MMVYGSVCSGIEAATVAWEPLGWKAAWLSEIEPFPNAVLAYRFPNIPNLGGNDNRGENSVRASLFHAFRNIRIEVDPDESPTELDAQPSCDKADKVR
jgi:site-specific DNA-cytosine methylase